MKMQTIGLPVFCLAAAIFLISCAAGTQNTNQNQTQNQTQNQNRSADETLDVLSGQPPSDDEICKITDPNTRIGELKKKLKGKIEGPKGKLWDQLNGAEIDGKKYPPSFAFEFLPFPSAGRPAYVHLYIAGTVHGRKPFEDLAEYAEDFVRRGCVDQVFFVGSLPGPDGRLVDDVPFQWSGCEYPLQVCTDGECRNPCVRRFNGRSETDGDARTTMSAPPSSNVADSANKGNQR